jgi:UDP-glucose 6-dehydrogenase
VDKDASKIEVLHRGGIPMFEPGLDALAASNDKAGRLDFTAPSSLASPGKLTFLGCTVVHAETRVWETLRR